MKGKRESGIIMPVFSLPGDFGIGTFGKDAYKFCDFLKKAGQKYWQILPLGPTGYGDSPYQSFSAFAGNPYFIDLDILSEENLLNKNDYIHRHFGSNPESVDYGAMFNEKMDVLKLAFKKFDTENQDFKKFLEEESFWIEDYSLFMALKYKFQFKSWHEWDIKLIKHDAETIKAYKTDLKDEINYWKFMQYEFFKQWKAVKDYANKNGIKIIGDIPIYVSADGADVWSNPEAFLLDKHTYKPLKVAGCPPDFFSADGQLWGNPIYDWEYLKSTGYKWWIDRIKSSLNLYDVIRIDHFRGFEAYWSINYGEITAKNGKWVKGPENDLFEAIKDSLGDIDIIAEDLGYITEDTIKFKEKTGFPGMKVLEFAFSGENDNKFLPHTYERNCVAYTGTHDNNTVRGWIEKTGGRDEVKRAVEYLNLTEQEGYNWGMIRGIWSSVAELSIAQMQDFLNLGNSARLNMPSTSFNNWSWRAKRDMFTDELADKILKITKIYGRCEQ